MIRIGFYVIISALTALIPICYALPTRILQGSPNQQPQIQNCTLPGISQPNIVSLGMCPNQIFIMPLAIGTPTQQLYMIPDTGQAYLQVLTNQTNQTGFNPLASTTFFDTNTAVTIQLENGQQISSIVANDIVTLNNGQDYSISISSSMLVISQYVPNEYSQVISGVAGLGLSMQYPNMFEIAYINDLIKTPSYTVSMTGYQPSIYYNQLPSQIIDSSIFIQSASLNLYALNIIGLFVGQTQYTSGAPDVAVISSGTSYFFLNQKVYDAAVSNFFNQCAQTPNGTTCECNSTSSWPVFSFMFEGAEVYIPPQSYVVNLSNGNCSYGFGYVQNDKEIIILGSSFFLNYNLTFNPIDVTIGMQGDLTPIQLIDFQYFVVLQYIFLVVSIAMAIFAGILVWYLRVVQKQQPTRTIQFGISDRFIETD